MSSGNPTTNHKRDAIKDFKVEKSNDERQDSQKLGKGDYRVAANG